jgi:hypothetical protein
MSAVRIDELTSEVVAEDVQTAGETQRAAAGAGSGATVWQEQAKHRALRERLQRDALRTRAEAYSD